MLTLRFRPPLSNLSSTLTASSILISQTNLLSSSSSPPCGLLPGFTARSAHWYKLLLSENRQPPLRAFTATSSPVSGTGSTAVEDVMIGYLFGNNKATEVAHMVWKHVVQKGDTVIDATCGNGNDTLALVRMVADESGSGCVYGLDIQEQALSNSSSLLDDSLTPDERQQVKLFPICHSRMEDVLPDGKLARLIAFNLGYLPGGEKSIITRPETTKLAMEAAKNRLAIGGLISIIAYVGHPGGREEYATVENFASQLPIDEWKCSKLQLLNRPTAPILILIFRK